MAWLSSEFKACGILAQLLAQPLQIRTIKGCWSGRYWLRKPRTSEAKSFSTLESSRGADAGLALGG
jgi:hypothetical protein